MERKGSSGAVEDWAQRYPEMTEKSFDEEVVERSTSRAVLMYKGPWHDLGSWETFASHMGGSQIGPGQVEESSLNTHLVNELNCPIHVIGISDAIVAASPSGILVASKSHSNRIKDVLGGQHRLPMLEEKRWGLCRTIDYSELENGSAVLTRKVEMQAGSQTSYHLHGLKEEGGRCLRAAASLCWRIRSSPFVREM